MVGEKFLKSLVLLFLVGVGDEGGIEMLVVVLVSLVFVGVFFVVGSSFRCSTPSPKWKFTIWLRRFPQKWG